MALVVFKRSEHEDPKKLRRERFARYSRNREILETALVAIETCGGKGISPEDRKRNIEEWFTAEVRSLKLRIPESDIPQYLRYMDT